jgi:hypothetical protein
VASKPIVPDLPTAAALMMNGDVWQLDRNLSRDRVAYSRLIEVSIENHYSFALACRQTGKANDDWFEDPRFTEPWKVDLLTEDLVDRWASVAGGCHYQGVRYRGRVLVQVFSANNRTRSLLSTVDTLRGWLAPRPENLAIFDNDGQLQFYSISHEDEVYLLRDSIFRL